MNIIDINKDQLTNSIRQYYDIKIDHLDVVILFQLGDFYEMFFEDAIEISNLLELTLTTKNAGLTEKIPMAGIPVKSLDEYLKKLIQHDKKVGIVTQVTDINIQNNLVHRKLSKIITPGTYHDPQNKDNIYICAISNEITPKISYIDLATGEANNADFFNLSEAINEAIRIGVKEIIVDYQIDLDFIDILNHYNIKVNYFERDCDFKLENQIIEHNDMTDINNLLLNYLCANNHNISHVTNFTYLISNNYMKLSLSTQRQLELIETMNDREYKGSLFAYLNQTKTAMGRRLLKKWITRPLFDLQQISYRQNIVESFSTNNQTVLLIIDILNQIYDFERIIGRLNDGVIAPREMYQLKKSICNLNNLKQLLLKFDNNDLNQLSANVDPLDDIYQLIEPAIEENNLISSLQGGIILANYNQELDRLRALKYNSKQWLAEFEIKEREKSNIKNLKIKYNKIFGYFIEITNSNIHLVPDNYIRKQTMANCERYITDELKQVENEILNAEDKINDLEAFLFDEIKQKIKKQIPRLKIVANQISMIDVLTTFSKISLENNLVRPKFSETNQINIEEGRHPIVETLVDEFIVNDCMMDKDIKTLLITGPNMAGKSTYMRQVVLISIMAQIGMNVPAKKAILPIFDQIFTRIGASDDLSQGQSTFMVEMNETAFALKYSTDDSLIIFDELGRGTSTYDGIALAQAIIEYLDQKNLSKVLFSTHYHELVTIAHDLKTVKNVHVKAQEVDDKLVFYHKLIDGAVQKSYGIQVASLAKIPTDVIYRSKEIIKQLEKDESNHIDINKVDNSINNQLINKINNLESELNKYSALKDIDLNNLTPMQAFEILKKI